MEEIDNPMQPPDSSAIKIHNNHSPSSVHCHYFRCRIQKNDFIEFINKMFSISIHIFIMSIFEIYFYFGYVINIEREKFITQIIAYSSQIKTQIEKIPIQKRKITLFIFAKTEETLYENYMQASKAQEKKLNELLYLSCKMSGIIGVFVLFFFALNAVYCKHLKWKTIFFENVAMFASLGAFEYMFFTQVILMYNPITDAEVEYIVYEQFVHNGTLVLR